MIYHLKNKNGFFSIQMVPVLLALLGIVFSFAFLSFVSQSKMQFRTKCTTETIELQKKIIQGEKALFKLNPLSTMLKYTYRGLQIGIAAATASANFVLAAKLAIELQKISKARKLLDQTQKTIINGANILIKAETARMTVQMNKAGTDTRDRWSYFLNAFFLVRPDGIPKFAVERDSDDIAPNYGLTKGYKAEQMVAYKWQLFFFTKSESQQVLESRGLFEMGCGATADRRDEKWLVEIRKDKF